MSRIISPEIGDETVTFRFTAPEAKLVRLYGSWMADYSSSYNMMKDTSGIWTLSIRKPSPELYTYHFIVDGLVVNDPRNIFMQRDGTRFLSVLLIPGELTENYFENRELLLEIAAYPLFAEWQRCHKGVLCSIALIFE